MMPAPRHLLRPMGVVLVVLLGVAFLVLTRPVPLLPSAASVATDAGGRVDDLSRQAQLAPRFAKDPAIHAMLPPDVRASGRMSVAMSVGIAPINFPGETAEEVKGLMPDLAAALEQILGVRFDRTIYPSTASQLLALESGRARLAVSTNSDTPERERSYDFINYMISANSLVMQAADRGRLRDGAQLCGKVFGEVKGSVSLLPTFAAACRRKGLPAPILAAFDDAPTMMLALASRRILCFVGSPFNTIYLRSQGVAVADILLPEAGLKYLGLTISKRDPAITAAVMAAMRKIADNGYYRKALRRWGLADYGIAPRLNLDPVPAAPPPHPKGIS